MVYYMLEYSAELENVESLHPTVDFQHLSDTFLFKLRCENCGTMTSKETGVRLDVQVPFSKRAYAGLFENILIEKRPKPRGSNWGPIYHDPVVKKAGFANAVQKCRFCGRRCTISMIPGFGRPLTAADGDGRQFVPLMIFDCKGLEPVNYAFAGTWWSVKSTSGMVYDFVNLSSGDWMEYDEVEYGPVAVANLKSKFKVVRGWKC